MARRLFAALDDLLAAAPAARRPPLERQRELLAAAVEDAYGDWRAIESARVPDIQGIGSGADVAAASGAVEEVARWSIPALAPGLQSSTFATRRE